VVDFICSLGLVSAVREQRDFVFLSVPNKVASLQIKNVLFDLELPHSLKWHTKDRDDIVCISLSWVCNVESPRTNVKICSVDPHS